MYAILFVGLYFQIFLLVTLLEVPPTKPRGSLRTANPERYPTVSITVPCWNEAKTLGGTVASLAALNYPQDKLTIIVVDDGSTDGTHEVAQKLSLTYPQIKVVHQKNGGKYSAQNFGLQNSTSEFVGCLDADSFVDRDALIQMMEYFDDPTVMAVTPAMRVYNPTRIIPLVQKAEYHIGIFLKNILGRINAIHVTPGPFSIFRREVFDRIGLYKHAHNTEDMEIAFRMQAHHMKIVNCSTAYVYTVVPPTVHKLYKQRVRWVYGFLNNLIDYKFLFLNGKYGNVGLFTLPFSLLFIFTTFVVVGKTFYDIGLTIARHIEQISTVGFTWPHHFNIDWFMINLGTTTLIGILLLCITLFFMLQGKKMAEGTMRPGIDMIYFTLLYGFIAPLWLSKAVYNTILSKKTPWR